MVTVIPRPVLLALSLMAALAPAFVATAGARAAAGDLDRSFSGDGLTTTSFTNGDGADQSRSVAIQRDGKSVVAGSSNQGPVRSTDFALARYNRDGSLDSSFGAGGRVVTDFGGRQQGLRDVAIAGDGKIVVAGSINFGRDSTGTDFAVARYTPGGSLDTSFGGGDGVATASFDNSRFFDGANGVVLLPGGKILLAGNSDQAPASAATADEDFALARFTADGTLDPTFSTDGKVTASFGPGNDGAGPVDVTPDGKYVASGESRQPSTGIDFATARFLPDGRLDASFSGDGRQTTALSAGSRSDVAGGMEVQRNGRIVVAGNADRGGATGVDYALLRYLPSGELDPSFGSGGTVFTGFDNGSGLDSANELTLQPDGKIVAGGNSIIDNVLSFSLARYRPDGSLDGTFSGDGRATASFGPRSSLFGFGLALQRDGKIVLSGYGRTPDTTTGDDFAVARFLGDQANLRASMSARPRPARVGGTVTFSAGVRNRGSEAATDARARITLPSGARFLSAGTSRGSCTRTSARTLRCAVGRIAAGSSVRISVRLRPTRAGVIRSSASVSSDTLDPSAGDNRASRSVRVAGRAEPGLTG